MHNHVKFLNIEHLHSEQFMLEQKEESTVCVCWSVGIGALAFWNWWFFAHTRSADATTANKIVCRRHRKIL